MTIHWDDGTPEQVLNLPPGARAFSEVMYTFALHRPHGQSYTIRATASMPGLLDAFVDFHGNGTFADSGDKIFDSVPLVAGGNQLLVPIAAYAVSGPTYARFRTRSRRV